MAHLPLKRCNLINICALDIRNLENLKNPFFHLLLRGCTRELRPVRGEQSNRERIFPNKCTFNIEQCLADRTRSPPLVLSANQDNIVYPSVGGK